MSSRRRLLRAGAAAAVLALSISLPASAHGGAGASSVSAEPAQVTAGGTVVFAGVGLEPDSERQINLVGPDVIVPFAAVTTDADGMFNATLTIPAHLPAGTYTFQAIGDETMTTELTVLAATGSTATEPKNEAAAVVTPRSRSTIELGILGLLVVAIVLMRLPSFVDVPWTFGQGAYGALP